MDVDVAVLGGGAAGLAAARETIRRGGRAAIVNDGPLGGDCTFTGCVPSKTVIEAAAAGRSFAEAFDAARRVRDRVAASESAAVLEGEGVSVVEAEGRLTVGDDGPAIEAAGRRIRAAAVVLALGSRPAMPPIAGLADVDALTTDTLWDLARKPRTMAVVGGGAVGCELSQALARLGVEVTVIEMAPRLLTAEEASAAAIVAQALTADGVELLTGVTVEAARPGPDGAARLHLGDGRMVEVERVLVATGRAPNGDRGGLAEAGIDLTDRGAVVNGDDLSTSVDGVFVAGDLSGRLQLTHAADHMGRLAAGNALRPRWRRPARFRSEHIPWVTFTDPEVARIGPTEAEAAATVDGARVAELPLTEHDRALAAGATDGYLKLIAAPRPVIGSVGGGRVIGATIVAARAGEMIAEIALAVRTGAFTGRLVQTVHPYPTWSYGVAKAAGQFFTTIEGRTARPARPG